MLGMASSRIDRPPLTLHQDTLRLCSVPTETQSMTCPQCYMHEHEIARLQAQLRRLKADAVPTIPVTPMTTMAGLTGQQETILSALWKAQGNAVSSSALSIALGEQSSKASIRVQLCRIKDKLGDGCISNLYGSGYYLTKKGLTKVAKLMETEQ